MMQLDDEGFVRQAYLRLLGRAADPEGFEAYMEQLRHGMPRADVYHDLAMSAEGQKYEARRHALRSSLTVVRSTLRQQPALRGGTSPQWLPAVQAPSWDMATPVVAHVNALLDLEGVAFVKAAYLALLGREVDEAGGINYVQRQRDGWSKMSMVKGLALSDEGRAFGNKLPGLSAALGRYAKAQRRSWGGWYYRSVLGVESDLPLERHLRAAHQALFRG